MTEKDYKQLILTARKKGDMKTSMLIWTVGSTEVRTSGFKFITVEPLRDGWTEVYNKRKSQVVLLSVELTRVLRKYCRRVGIVPGSIFVIKHENPMDRSNVSKKTKQPGREAGVDTAKIFSHNFRHPFARILHGIGKDVIRLMDPLGHSSISTTRIYTVATEEQPRRRVSRIQMMLG